MTLRLHISDHNDDLHNTTAKRNTANGVAGLNAVGNIFSNIESSVLGIENKYTLGNTQYHGHTGTQTTTNTTPTKLKTIEIDTLILLSATIRITWQLATTSGTAYGQLYKNGSPIGTLRSTTFWTWSNYSEDLSFSQGDKIEMYAYCSAGGNVSVGTMYVKGDITPITLAEALDNDTHGCTTTPITCTNSTP